MTISIIVAISENNVIGKNNDLIWHISEDLKRFKKLTSGHSIIMGRKTYESLPFKPLPKRKNIILSFKDIKFEGAYVVNNLEDAIKLCEGEDEIFICGGAEIYKRFIPLVDKLYITKVHKKFEGDTFFPKINYNEWKLIERSKRLYDKNSDLDYTFLDYTKNELE